MKWWNNDWWKYVGPVTAVSVVGAAWAMWTRFADRREKKAKEQQDALDKVESQRREAIDRLVLEVFATYTGRVFTTADVVQMVATRGVIATEAEVQGAISLHLGNKKIKPIAGGYWME